MLNKARKKFIKWSVISLAVIVAVLITVINLMNWNHVNTSLETAITEIAASHGSDKKGEKGVKEDKSVLIDDSGTEEKENKRESFGYREEESGSTVENESTPNIEFGEKSGKGKDGRKSADVQYGSRYFIVHFRPDGSLDGLIQNQDAVTSEQALNLMENVKNKGNSEGYVDGYKYLVMSNETVVFLDCSTEISHAFSLLITSVIVGLLGIILAFIFIIIVSKKIVEPVRVSIEKQKQFTTNAGHGLKTPLAAITMNMDIISMELEDNEWVEETQNQIKKMCKLVENLIALSKVDEEDMLKDEMQFSVSDIADEYLEGFQKIAQLQDKKLDLNIERNLLIMGDPDLWQQLISILSENAIKYSAGQEPIEIKLFKEGKFVVFETANEWSKDVDPNNLNQLFERFYRGDPAMTSDSKPEGHGVGLSIAKAMVEKNKGSITAGLDSRGWIVFCVKIKTIFCS